MRTPHRRLTIPLVMCVILTACGSGSSSDTTRPGDAASSVDTTSPSTATTAPPDTAPGTTTSVEPTPSQDAGQIDWATVDLTTIDWATIDMNLIDFEAIRDNPTAADLDEETTSLIQSRMDPGHATLTIGDQTYEFETFLCAFGHDATQSSVYSFSSDTRGQVGEAQVQMQANIRDESGQGRYEGDGLTHEVFIADISDFENPSISFEMNAPDGIVIDGNDVTAEGNFDDQLTEGTIEEIPGTLDATCGTASRR